MRSDTDGGRKSAASSGREPRRFWTRRASPSVPRRPKMPACVWFRRAAPAWSRGAAAATRTWSSTASCRRGAGSTSSSLHLDIPDVVQDILAADAVDKEQCLVSAMRPAQRVTSIPEPLPETSQTAAETESSLVSPQPTNPAHVVPGLGKRVCEPPPEAPPLARKRYRLTKKTGPHSKTGRCEPPPTTPTFALAVAGAATAMAAAVAPSTSASDSSKNTAKRAADAAEVCAAARPKRQDEHASKTSAAELFSSDAAALPTVPGHASSASVQCDPPPVLPERGICSTCLDSLQADTAPQDKEQSSSRSSNRFCQYIFPTPEACGFDWPVATRASGVSSALSSPRGAQTTSGSQHSPSCSFAMSWRPPTEFSPPTAEAFHSQPPAGPLGPA